MTIGQGPKEPPRGGEARGSARTQTAFGGATQTLSVGWRSTADARVFPSGTAPAARYSFTAEISATEPPSVSVPVPASTRVPEPELQILQYEVIKELGRGGMGVVYLARDNRLARKVAIKLLQNSHPEFTRRFIIEARATARCGHENIVVIYEVGEFRGSPFMVLEYLKGQTLAALLEKSPVLPAGRAVELMVSVVRALACAHAQGIVHRDLKPENIFLQETGTLKVLDFGIAKVLESEQVLPESRRELGRTTLFGMPSGEDESETGIAGTMAYMSPEQWGVGGPIDHHTDIWTTGVILFEILSGVHPLVVVNADPRLWVARMDLPMPSLRQVAPQVPEGLADVVDRCLMKAQSARFPDAVALLRELEPFLPGRGASNVIHADRGPYAGLRSFQEDDAGRFFGRSREIAEMATRIRDYPLSAVVGASGVGKSSFIRAGVVPALKGSGESWEVLVARPGREPLLALAALLSPLVGTSPTLVADLGAQAELAERLLREPGYFGSVLRLDARRAGRRILLFVDQFEELYTQNADLALRRAFTACLSAAADDVTSPVRVVVSIRADFLARAAEDPQFMNDLAKGMLVLPPPTAEGLRDALVQPAALAGYRFENDAMVDEMVRHLEAAPGALPLVQFTAAQLWEKRDVTRRALTQAHYDAIGGIAGALVSHADRVIAKLANEALVRSVFVNLVTEERTRAVRLLSELYEIGGDPAEIRRLVDHLVESRLLVVQRGAGEGDATVEVIHESLIAAWPALRRWLDESHGDSLFAEQLRAAARQWHANRHDSGLLWGGEMVDELERFQQRFRGEFSPMTQAFVSAVFEQRARGTRRRRWFAAAGASLVVGLLAAAAVTVVVVSKAQKEAESNAVIATRNGADAQRRLREVEAKEKERIREETRRQAAEKEASAAQGQVQLSNAQLAEKNEELVATLARAEQQRALAVSAQGRALENEQTARTAEERAKSSAAELEKLLARERERTSRLTAQLGSLVEKLP